MLGLFAFAGIHAQDTTDPSYWDEEKLAEYDANVTGSYADVIYMKSCIFPAGSGVVKFPINIKAHQDFMNVQFRTVLPEGLYPNDRETALGGMVIITGTDRIVSGLVDGKNFTDKGYTQYVTKNSDVSSKEDDVYFYIEADISSLEAGVYDLKVLSGAIFAGFSDDYNGRIVTDGEIVTKLVISDEVVLDENDEEYPGTYAGVNVKVLRTISANNWNTLCLPFDMTEEQCKEVFGDDVELAEFAGRDTLYIKNEMTLNMKFESIKSITKNRPCIIKINNDITEFKVENVNIEPIAEEDADNEELVVAVGNDKMIGTYKNGTELWYKVKRVEVSYMFISNNLFWFASETTKPMKGFRAYFDLDDPDDFMKESENEIKMVFNVDDEPTSIDGITTIEKVADGVYNVSGQKVSESSVQGLPKGIYIVNGKKVFVK